jgi:hypothetical protein
LEAVRPEDDYEWLALAMDVLQVEKVRRVGKVKCITKWRRMVQVFAAGAEKVIEADGVPHRKPCRRHIQSQQAG